MNLGLEEKLEQIETREKTLEGISVTWPTIIATTISMPLAAVTADVTHGYLPELKGPINELITSGLSDLVLFLTYNVTFPVAYAIINRKHYNQKDGFNYKQCATDLIFKIAPAGGITALLLYHTPRNVAQTAAMALGLRPAYASLFADTIITIIYIPIRNKVLKFMDEPINVGLKKAREVLNTLKTT